MGLSGGNLLLFCPLINGDLRGLWGSSLPHVPQPRISQRLHPLLSENSDSVVTLFGFADYVLSNPILRAARCEFLGSIRWQEPWLFFFVQNSTRQPRQNPFSGQGHSCTLHYSLLQECSLRFSDPPGWIKHHPKPASAGLNPAMSSGCRAASMASLIPPPCPLPCLFLLAHF